MNTEAIIELKSQPINWQSCDFCIDGPTMVRR